MKGRNGRSFVPRELKPFFLFRSLSVLKEKRFPSFLPLYGNRNEVGVRYEGDTKTDYSTRKKKKSGFILKMKVINQVIIQKNPLNLKDRKNFKSVITYYIVFRFLGFLTELNLFVPKPFDKNGVYFD